MYTKAKLAPLGTTANTTHPSVGVAENAYAVAMSFNLTAIGAAPTVTYKLQGSLDSGDVSDALSAWFDLMMLPGASDVAVATDTKTTVASFAYFLATARLAVRKVRLVTSAINNVTYNADLAVKSGL